MSVSNKTIEAQDKEIEGQIEINKNQKQQIVVLQETAVKEEEICNEKIYRITNTLDHTRKENKKALKVEYWKGAKTGVVVGVAVTILGVIILN